MSNKLTHHSSLKYCEKTFDFFNCLEILYERFKQPTFFLIKIIKISSNLKII